MCASDACNVRITPLGVSRYFLALPLGGLTPPAIASVVNYSRLVSNQRDDVRAYEKTDNTNNRNLYSILFQAPCPLYLVLWRPRLFITMHCILYPYRYIKIIYYHALYSIAISVYQDYFCYLSIKQVLFHRVIIKYKNR